MKNWFITGASSGIGRIMVETLLSRGDRVAATIRREGTLDALRAEHGDRLMPVVLDLTDITGMRRAVAGMIGGFGRIDVMVSNAGYGLFGAIEEVSDAQIDRQIATNLTGSIQLIRAFLPHLREQGGGRIIQVSSEGGQVTYPGFGLYHATKWGIEGFVEALSKEMAPFGIDCMIAEPGPTGTNFRGNLDLAEAMEAYRGSPAGAVREAIASGAFKLKGDAQRTAVAIIAAADAEAMPLRLALGSTAYENIEAALVLRLEAVRAQKPVAFGADAADIR